MKILAQTILLILMSSAAYGQYLTGQWKGTIQVQGNQLQIVFHVAKTNDQYEATMDSPNQNANGTKVTAINFRYPKVKFEISSIGAVYEGTMSDQGITGKWVQSGTALFLALSKNKDSAQENGKP